VAGFAELFATLQLRIDKPAAEKAMREAVSGRASADAGKAAGTQFSGGFAKEAETRAKTVAGKLVSTTEAKAEGEKAGKALGEGIAAKAGAEAKAAGEKGGREYSEGFRDTAGEAIGSLKGMLFGALAAGGAVELFKGLIEGGETAERTAKIVEQAIRSTGGAARVSADDIDKLAASESSRNAVDKLSIEQASTMLLRFTDVRNEVGKGNDVFNRASQAAIDLTAAMHGGVVSAGSLSQTTKALGKALDDPAKGMTALRRFGVVLTAQQQDQVKAFTKSGDTLKAQKVILDALGKSYGGTAAAAATPMARLQVTLHSLEEEVGQKLLPAFNGLIGLLAKMVGPLAAVIGWFTGGSKAADLLRWAILAIGGGLLVYTAYVKVAKLATDAWKFAQAALNLELDANPIGLIIAAIAALVIGLIYAYQHSKAFRDVVHDMWDVLRAAAAWIASAWMATWHALDAAYQATYNWLRANWPLVLGILTGPVGLAVVLIAKHWATIRAGAAALLGWFHQIFGTDLANFFTKTVPAIWDRFWAATVTRLWNRWRAGWRAELAWIHQVFYTDVLGFFTRTLPGVWDRAIGLARSRLWQPFTSGLQGLLNWIHQVFGTDVANFFTRTLPAVFQTSVAAIGRWWNNLQNTVASPVRWVINTVLDGLIGAFDWITSHVGLGSPIKKISAGFAGGGRITAGTTPTADDVLVRVSRDETIVSADHSRVLAGAFAAVGVPGYQGGGVPHRTGQAPPNPGGGGGLFSGITHLAAHAASSVAHAATSAAGAVAHTVTGVVDKALDVAKLTAAFATGNRTAFVNAFADFTHMGSGGAEKGKLLDQILLQIPKELIGKLIDWIMGRSGGSGSGADIANYAATFIGKIPYTWGGTSLSGCDCSGFTQAIYNHFGIHAPRTSEAQGAWVKRGAPETGGLAFYHSPAGGPDPGHVAIVKNAAMVISQGGGMGPQLMGINDMPLLWTGTPPSGFGGAVSGTVGQWISTALALAGEPASWASLMGILVGKESGGNARAENPISVLGQHAEGVAQMLPATFLQYALAGHGDIWNPVDNLASAARYIAAIYRSPSAISGLTSGTYYGYANGGPVSEPVSGIGALSGKLYRFGESGTEWVVPDRPGSGDGGGQAPLIGSYHTNYYGTGDAAAAMRELAFTLRKARMGAFSRP
jgi:cell wall-associated NlpC family hydrolase